jgi:hypothetical protein
MNIDQYRKNITLYWGWKYLISNNVESLLFSPCTPLSSTNKNDRQDITEILLKVTLNTIMITPNSLTIHGYSIVIVEVKDVID